MLISNSINADINNKRKLDKLVIGEKYYLQMNHNIKFENEGLKYVWVKWVKAVFVGISGVNQKVLIFKGKYSKYNEGNDVLMTVNTLDFLYNPHLVLTSEEYYEKMNKAKEN